MFDQFSSNPLGLLMDKARSATDPAQKAVFTGQFFQQRALDPRLGGLGLPAPQFAQPAAPAPAPSGGGFMMPNDGSPLPTPHPFSTPNDIFSGPPKSALKGSAYMPDRRRPGEFADGGMVRGPGGPKDDAIPARLSDGEFVMPAEAVMFHGLDKMHKMVSKAREEMHQSVPGSSFMVHGSNNQEPSTKNHEPMMPMMKDGGMMMKDMPRMPMMPMMPMMHMAEGGFVNPSDATLPTLEDMRFRGFAARANLDAANAGLPTDPNGPMVTPSAPIFQPPTSPPLSTLEAPWERDARLATERADAAPLIPGLNRTQTRHFQQSPPGILFGLNAAQHQQDQLLAGRAAAAKRANKVADDDLAFQRQQQLAQEADARAQSNWQTRNTVTHGQKVEDAANARAAQSIASFTTIPLPDGRVMPVAIAHDGAVSMLGGGPVDLKKRDPAQLKALEKSINDPGLLDSVREAARKQYSELLGIDVPMPSRKPPSTHNVFQEMDPETGKPSGRFHLFDQQGGYRYFDPKAQGGADSGSKWQQWAKGKQ